MLDKITKVTQNIFSRVNLGAKTSDRYIVGLDIGTENVKAVIGKINGSQIDIIGVGKAHQGLSDMQAGAVADIAAVTSNCNTALAAAESEAGVSARAVVMGIAGELVKGTTISITVTRSDPKTPLDIDEVERIISAVQKKAFAKARTKISEELGGKEVDIQLVNSALVRMEIDGYVVTNPVSFQGKDVTVQLYTAFAPLIHTGALEQISRQLDMDLLAVAAEPFAVARSVIGDNEESTMSAILMDVGGGTTDIAVVNEGGVQGTQMFGIGGRAFTRSIERDEGVSFDEAESLKIALSKGAVPDRKLKKIKTSLNKTTKVWQSGVGLALDEFNQLDHLPSSLLLCGGGASLDMLVDELEQSNWYRSLPFAKKPTVKYITPDAVIGITDTTDRLDDHTFITAMGLLRVGLDTISQSEIKDSDSASIRDRINRVLRI